MKTNKHQTLRFIKGREKVRAKNISDQFGYSLDIARSYLSHLGRQGLMGRTDIGYILSEKGVARGPPRGKPKVNRSVFPDAFLYPILFCASSGAFITDSTLQFLRKFRKKDFGAYLEPCRQP